MRRDMDLIRELMLKLEALPLEPGAVVHIESHEDEVAVEGFTVDVIEYHLDQIRRLDFIDGAGSQPMTGIYFRCLTPAGHDFVDTFRDAETFTKAKDIGNKAGGWSLDILLDVGKMLIKEGVKAQLAKIGVPLP